jgi:hypothetical protein
MSERKRILITVRTYPVPATKGVEVSCTAGITEGQQWIRIFPIPYRFLQPDRREPVLAIVPGQAIRSAHPAPLNDRPGGPIPPPSQAGTVELPPTIAVIAVEVCRGQGPLRRGCPIRATPGQRRCNRLGLGGRVGETRTDRATALGRLLPVCWHRPGADVVVHRPWPQDRVGGLPASCTVAPCDHPAAYRPGGVHRARLRLVRSVRRRRPRPGASRRRQFGRRHQAS